MNKQRTRRIRFALLGASALVGAGAATAFLAASACNTGIFAPTSNAGLAVCECTCGTSLDPDAGDACLANCVAPFDSAEEVAFADGCQDAFGDYSTCLERHGSCDGRSFDAPDCGAQELALQTCEEHGATGG